MTAAPRVLFVMGANGTGGTELQARALIAALQNRGVTTQVVLLDASQGLSGLPLDTKVIASDRPGAFQGLLTYASAILRIRRLLRSGKYDVVHAVHARGYTVAAVAAFGVSDVRTVAWRRNLGIHLAGGNAVFTRLLERASLRVTDVVLANSNDVRDYWVSHYGLSPARALVVPNMLQDWRFDVERAPLTNPKRIVAVGGLRPVKGHNVLLQAVSGLGRRDIEVVILGDGECHSMLRGLAKELGVSLVLPGVQTDPRPWLASATLYAHPSLSEGASNAVLEAMAAGAPIVASDVGGMRELLGDTGVLVPAGDVGRLSEAIERLLASHSDRQVLGDAARHRARERFSENSIVTITVNVYKGELPCVGL